MKIFSKFFKPAAKGATLILDAQGPHQIGGKPEGNFRLPKLESSPMVYLGCIKKGNAPSMYFLNRNRRCLLM